MNRGILGVLIGTCLASCATAWAQGGQNSQDAYVYGRVAVDDGSPPTSTVSIESLCGAQRSVVAVADATGWFSFRYGALGNRNLQDASVGLTDTSVPRQTAPSGAASTGSSQSSTASGGAQQTGGDSQQQQQSSSPATPRPGFNDRQIRACEIRASLPGYRSDEVNFANRRPTDNPNLGTLILHPLVRSRGQVVSVAALAVSKDARKAYQAGLAALKRKKPEIARADFEKAARLYPRYAAAWCEIGKLDTQQGRPDDARRSFDQAIQVAPSYAQSYALISPMLAAGREWPRLGDATDRLLKLDPFDYPQAYYYRAVAAFNTGNPQAAEKDVRQAQRLDDRRRWPETWLLLGRIYAARGDYAAAGRQLRMYLTLVPQSPSAAAIRAQAVGYEQRAAQATARANTPQP